MNAKTFEKFSPRDQGELQNVLLELQKLDPPQYGADQPPEVSYAHHDFYLGRAKQFRITRIK